MAPFEIASRRARSRSCTGWAPSPLGSGSEAVPPRHAHFSTRTAAPIDTSGALERRRRRPRDAPRVAADGLRLAHPRRSRRERPAPSATSRSRQTAPRCCGSLAASRLSVASPCPAPNHDALLVEGPADGIDAVVQATQAAMAEASAIVLNGFRLRSDAKVVRYPDRYADPRGARMWTVVQSLLRAAGPVQQRTGDLSTGGQVATEGNLSTGGQEPVQRRAPASPLLSLMRC